MDLMGLTKVKSLGGKQYAFVCVDDFSRYTWMRFLRHKSDAFDMFRTLDLQLQREKNLRIALIRNDNGKKNLKMLSELNFTTRKVFIMSFNFYSHYPLVKWVHGMQKSNITRNDSGYVIC